MFTGFTDATVDFLWGIRFNNERPWFEAHKETYLSELYRPMKDLGAEIYDFLSEQRPDDPMVCRVSRIYRDARRLHGRGPYKDHLWFCVERPTGLLGLRYGLLDGPAHGHGQAALADHQGPEAHGKADEGAAWPDGIYSGR